jgi:hypothetical protein
MKIPTPARSSNALTKANSVSFLTAGMFLPLSHIRTGWNSGLSGIDFAKAPTFDGPLMVSEVNVNRVQQW